MASHWVAMVLWMLGLFALGLGILIYVVVIRPDAADRKRLESGSAEPEDEPVPMTWGSCAFGCAYLCFRIIVYLIIIYAVVVGGFMLLDAFNQMD